MCLLHCYNHWMLWEFFNLLWKETKLTYKVKSNTVIKLRT